MNSVLISCKFHVSYTKKDEILDYKSPDLMILETYNIYKLVYRIYMIILLHINIDMCVYFHMYNIYQYIYVYVYIQEKS